MVVDPVDASHVSFNNSVVTVQQSQKHLGLILPRSKAGLRSSYLKFYFFLTRPICFFQYKIQKRSELL